MTWLKRQLREAQDTIIQLHEAQRMSEERNAKHFKECGPTMENIHGSGQCAEEAEREHGFAKTSNESEKAQLVSQENASDIKTADEARSMINRLHFCLLKRGMDFVSPCPVSYREVGTLTGTRADKHTTCNAGDPSITKDSVRWTHEFEERHCSLTGVVILETPATVCRLPATCTLQQMIARQKSRPLQWVVGV
jgi:hypothetical protein